MRNDLIVAVTALGLCLAPAAWAQNADAVAEAEGPAPVIRETDRSLTCRQVADEAAQLSETMGGTPEGSLFGALGGVARSGAAMLIPGAGLLMAGADALSKPDRDRREAEAAAVQYRWYYLNGLYSGRECVEQAEASQTPPAASEQVPMNEPRR